MIYGPTCIHCQTLDPERFHALLIHWIRMRENAKLN